MYVSVLGSSSSREPNDLTCEWKMRGKVSKQKQGTRPGSSRDLVSPFRTPPPRVEPTPSSNISLSKAHGVDGLGGLLLGCVGGGWVCSGSRGSWEGVTYLFSKRSLKGPPRPPSGPDGGATEWLFMIPPCPKPFWHKLVHAISTRRPWHYPKRPTHRPTRKWRTCPASSRARQCSRSQMNPRSRHQSLSG